MTRAPGSSPSPVVTVLVVDDSPVQRRFLRAVIDSDPAFEVVGEARTGREAVALVEQLRPAAVLMDLDLPVMNGMEAIERIMAGRPTPIVVYSAFVEGADSENAVAATAAGAVDVIAKPAPGQHDLIDGYAQELRRRLRVASRARVITHPRGRLRHNGVANGNSLPVGTLPAHASQPAQQADAETRRADTVRAQVQPITGPVHLVVIGASTGGPQALSQLLPELPSDFEPALLVVQHMAEGFIEGLAGWLDGLATLPVRVGESGTRLEPGTVTVAPSGLNLVVHDRRLRVTCEKPPTTQFHVPGIDATFRSVAQNVGAESIGVLLTGMGRDGAAGLKALRDRGATTLAQDESTSAVYGMPQAARALGAVDHELPLLDIAPTLLALLSYRGEREEVGA